MTKWNDRPATELMLLGITGVIGFVIVLFAIAVCIIKVVHPEANIDRAATTLSDTLGALIALLAGYGAGRAATATSTRKPPEGGP
jgi:hypothetical protein